MVEIARTISKQAFHVISQDMEDCISDIRIHAELLTPQQVSDLSECINHANGHRGLDVSEVDKQYQLFLEMQKQVIDPRGNMLDGVSIKDIGSVISAMSSLISLFLKAQKDLDIIRDQADLKDAVLQAVKDAPDDVRERFFTRLSELEESNTRKR